MTDAEQAEASFNQDADTGRLRREPRFGTSLRRRATRRRDGTRPSAASQPALQLLGGSAVPAIRGLLAATAPFQSASDSFAAVICTTCQVEFDAFSGTTEAAFFALIHNGLHHGTRPVAVVSPSGMIA